MPKQEVPQLAYAEISATIIRSDGTEIPLGKISDSRWRWRFTKEGRRAKKLIREANSQWQQKS